MKHPESYKSPAVYLLKLNEPLKRSNGNGASYYLGSAKNLQERLEMHRKGRGARFIEVAIERGISFEVVRVWRTKTVTEARLLEQKLKARHNHKSLCITKMKN